MVPSTLARTAFSRAAEAAPNYTERLTMPSQQLSWPSIGISLYMHLIYTSPRTKGGFPKRKSLPRPAFQPCSIQHRR